MKMKFTFFSIVLIAFAFGSCKTKFDDRMQTAGDADFTSYVAIGASYSAGFADGALSKEGQAASFPVLLANKFQELGGGVFHVPYLTGNKGVYPDPLASNVHNTLSRLALKTIMNCKGEQMLLPQRIAETGDNDEIDFSDITNRIYTPGAIYHHHGIPAMKSFHAAQSFYAYDAFFENDQFNPFFWRYASNTFGSLMFDVIAAKPTFFTLELGMSDVLNYAIDGGIGKEKGYYEVLLKEDLTGKQKFTEGITKVLDSLTKVGAKGVITNIPDVLTFPYFRKIEYNALDIDASKAQALTTQYAGLGLTFTAGKNAFVIKDKGVIRQLKPTEFITLKTPVDSLKCADWGASKPIEDIYILTEEEIALVNSHTDLYNTILNDAASTRGIPMMDLKSFFIKLNAGITQSGIDLSSEFVSGGFFSLDGLHPNPRGQAMLANEYISVINENFKASIAPYNIGMFQGAIFP